MEMKDIRRPLSSFMYFLRDKRPQILEQNPMVAFGEMGKFLGETWHNLSDDEIAPYRDLASKDKSRYERAIHGKLS